MKHVNVLRESGSLSILHVTADYPDAFDARKTPAVRNFIALVEDQFDHRVMSLNRTSPNWAQWLGMVTGHRGAIIEACTDGETQALRYAGFPNGVLHATMLHRLADALCARIARDRVPQLLVGYKLTVEGLVVAEMARRLGVPYALAIQGNTDVRIIAARPDLRGAFAAALRGAAVIFSLAPWALRRVETMLGVRAGAVVPLPCPIALDTPVAPRVTGGKLLTAFHLRHHHLKNFARLARAVEAARGSDHDLELEVIGGGSASEIATVRRLAQKTHGIDLIGAVPNADMPDWYNNAAGFVLPSLRESFGMVFLEALFCGTPVVYPAGRAISGWFDDEPFAIAVDPRDVGAIADGLQRLKRDEGRLKSDLARWQTSVPACRFTRAAISSAFGQGLQTAALGLQGAGGVAS